MPLPSYQVLLSFGGGGAVNITEYVQSISINRGIDRNLDDFSAGSLSITFVNNDRVFDPLNSSSPLWRTGFGYSLVQPGGQILVNSNGVRRFTGFVQDWSFSYDDAGFDATATVTALDLMYKISTAEFTGGTAYAVQATSDRINTIMESKGFTSLDFLGVRGGQTLLGWDVREPGDNVLSYLQNVARSEPADFFCNASGRMVLKDRSFTNYQWENSARYNYVTQPATANKQSNDNPDGTWLLLGSQSSAIPNLYDRPPWRGGTVEDTINPPDSFVGFDYRDITPARYGPSGLSYAFAGSLRGVNGTYDISAFLYDENFGVIASTAITVTSSSTAQWVDFQTSLDATSKVAGVQFTAGVFGGTAFTVFGDGFIIEPQGTSVNYFNGSYNPYENTASTDYEVAWSADIYASQSGLLTSTATAIAAPVLVTFADANSQGTAFGNGTGIPFTNLDVVYASEQLYNEVQVVGVNRSFVAEDLDSQDLYGLRTYSQTDNLTTSTTKPKAIASALLGEFRRPEYRANRLTVALESLTTTQQTQVLGIEIRDVVRVCFRPSNQGDVVDKFYQVLGVSADADVERDALTLNLASLDNLSFRFDSPYLGVLDTDTLA